MLLTNDFLQALRRGEYGFIRVWEKSLQAQFVYSEEYTAEILIPLITFELLNHGFDLSYFREVQTIFALAMQREELQVPGELAYLFTLLVTAGLQCFVYEDKLLEVFYKTDRVLSLKEIITLMEADNRVLTAEANSQALKERFDSLEKTLQGDELGKLKKITDEMKELCRYQSLCEDYLSLFESARAPDDEAAAGRLKQLKLLNDYLQNQGKITVLIKEEVNHYVNRIRELNPAPTEEPYLSGLFESRILAESRSIFSYLYEVSGNTWFFFYESVLSNKCSA